MTATNQPVELLQSFRFAKNAPFSYFMFPSGEPVLAPLSLKEHRNG